MKYERAKSDPGPNIWYLKMAALASKEHDTELVCFKRRTQFANYKPLKLGGEDSQLIVIQVSHLD